MPRRWRLTLFLFVLGGLHYADRAALAAVIPPLRTDIGVTDAQVGLAGMLFLWCYALCSPLAGNLADRFSRPRIITWSVILWSIVMAATGFVQGAVGLLAARALLGVAESLYLPAAGALLVDHHRPETRGRAASVHIVGMNVGVILGGAVAGLLAEHYGWRAGFWLFGGLGIAIGAISPRFLPEAPRKEPATQTAPKRDARGAWAYVLRVPTFHCILLNAMISGVATWIFNSWLALFFFENYDMKLGAAGLLGGVLLNAPVFLGLAIGGWISDAIVRRNVYGRALIKGLSCLVCAPFHILFIGSPTLAVVTVALVFSSMLRSVGSVGDHALICEIVPQRYRSTAIGIFNTCGTGAGGVGVLFAGILKQDLGLNTIFGAATVLYFLAGLPVLWAYRYSLRRDMERAALEERGISSRPTSNIQTNDA